MATNTPPPYFPQSSLSPPDAKRYRKFKLALFGIAVILLLIIGGLVIGAVFLLKRLS